MLWENTLSKARKGRKGSLWPTVPDSVHHDRSQGKRGSRGGKLADHTQASERGSSEWARLSDLRAHPPVRVTYLLQRGPTAYRFQNFPKKVWRSRVQTHELTRDFPLSSCDND